ncbi:substrate-binding domain-containing protein [Bradyrhizobium sp. SYSU BS000235]|uniref:substrate-binding domain-containing protein n=1 Tax=Bradyrhizobium sp. SYSU BS000235 TaxID=3411332 RepID=UPI003C70C03C
MGDAVRVFSTLALMGAIRGLAGRYEADFGVKIDVEFAPTLALLKRLEGGETADVLVLTREALADLASQGRVVSDSCVDLARSYVGLAVKAGAAHPDISSVAALRETLLNARCVGYSRLGASGIYFAKLIEQMEIAPQVNANAKVIQAGLTAELLPTGEAELAVQQISELKLVPGIEVVGPIPVELQQNPAVFSAGRMAASQKVEQTNGLLKFLKSSDVAPALRESGLEP